MPNCTSCRSHRLSDAQCTQDTHCSCSLSTSGILDCDAHAPGAVGPGNGGEGVSGMKELGVKELTYKLAFLACCAQVWALVCRVLTWLSPLTRTRAQLCLSKRYFCRIGLLLGRDKPFSVVAACKHPLPPDGQTAEAQSGMTNIRSEEAGTPEEVAAAFSEEEREELGAMQRNPRIYTDMARSIAPGVFGHQDIKCAILLMLLGGVHKTTREVRSAATGRLPPCQLQLSAFAVARALLRASQCFTSNGLLPRSSAGSV